MAGKIQLLSRGAMTEELTGDPSFSYFTEMYSKRTNWKHEKVKMGLDNPVETNSSLNFRIPNNCGDLIQNMSLSFSCDFTQLNSLVEETLGGGVSIIPINLFGISVIEYVELYLGNELIDRVSSDDIYIHRELYIPETYKNNTYKLQGQLGERRNFAVSPEWFDGMYSGTLPANNEFIIDIPFYFHGRPRYGFPLCSVYNQELEVKIKLRPASDLFYAGKDRYQSFGYEPEEAKKIVNEYIFDSFNLNLDVIHLNCTERYKLKSTPTDILIEQNQRNEFNIDPESKNGEFKLDFKNCVKELYFITKKKGEWSQQQIEDLDYNRAIPGSSLQTLEVEYYARSQIAKKNVPLIYSRPLRTTLKCDGIDVIKGEYGTNQFLNSGIPNIYHKHSPVDTNINVYPFALYPHMLQPCGHCDFSTINDAIVNIDLVYDGVHSYYNTQTGDIDVNFRRIYFPKQVVIIAKSYNVLRLKNGAAKLLF